jgi:cytochrome c5
MTRISALVVATGVLGLLGTLMAQSAPTATDQQERSQKNQPAATVAASPGEHVFQQHCSRCHNAPQGFPPQISGTILRHMRVRASLSATDEKALLHFLNP